MTRYPIYIPSKGRWQDERRLTARALEHDEIPYHLVVEPQEQEAYTRAAGGDRVLTLPFSNLGRGSIPARNWIRDHAESRGYAKHWVIDDNIVMLYRLWEARRVPVHAGVALRVCEDFSDRFTNVALSGLSYDMFVIPNGSSGIGAPYFRNSHIYSAILVNSAMPYRWRGRFNEDTDLCLQALTGGWATVLINAVMVKKATTMTVSGGNEQLYGEGSDRDTMGRFEMARSLERTWPGLVTLSRKYGRFQHSVDWSRFTTSLRLRDDVDLEALPPIDEYGLTLRPIREVRSETIWRLYETYEETLASLTVPDPLWRGLPAFRPIASPPKLSVQFESEAAREELVEKLAVTVDKKYTTGKAWSAWHPNRPREDPASLRFEPLRAEGSRDEPPRAGDPSPP